LHRFAIALIAFAFTLLSPEVNLEKMREIASLPLYISSASIVLATIRLSLACKVFLKKFRTAGCFISASSFTIEAFLWLSFVSINSLINSLAF